MALIDIGGIAHIRLTVTDIARSKAFYDRVFGFPAVIDNSERIDEPGITESAANFFGGVVYQLPGGTLLGLRPVALDGDRFDPDRTGLDHLSFTATSRAQLNAVSSALDAAGISRGDITEFEGGAFLVFFDPDGISLELSLGPEGHPPQ